MADFYSRVSKRSQSSWVTEAVTAMAATHEKEFGVDWRDYADIEEGMTDYLFAVSGLPLKEDEEERARFIMHHRPFFANKVGAKWKPDRKKIHLLWPQIQHFVESWYMSKGDDIWATGREMAKMLKQHEIVVQWGPGVETE